MHGPSARVLLHARVHQIGDFIWELAWRDELIRNRGLVEAVDRLYFDDRKNKPKRGAVTSTQPGNLRRFVSVLQQFDLTYDLHGMTAAQILALLPAEFDGWRVAADS